MTRRIAWPVVAIVTVFPILTLTSVCFAQLAMGPMLAAGQTLHGRFVEERHLKGLSSTLKSEGSFVLAPGKGLIWRIEQPIQTLTVITPAAIRQIINGSEVQHIDAARVPFIAHFYDMLNGSLIGDWSAMRHDFAVKSTGDRQAWRTVLTPLQPDDPVAGMLASIVISGGKLIDSVDINRTNGDSEHMAFLDQKVSNVPLVGEEARLLDSRPAS
ncbi:MAG: outer membrane lipoprotein carrier protein LolA [Candidatus Binatus sp.]|uniref:LolA family protein n=1 Tax=Candidatus Binatus sp. TaxID=2811406 RepID=UPI003C72BB24